MLVLRRSCGQSIVIGNNGEIIVKILRDDKGVISLGIEAPKAMRVDRQEIYEKRKLNIICNDNSNLNLHSINE